MSCRLSRLRRIYCCEFSEQGLVVEGVVGNRAEVPDFHACPHAVTRSPQATRLGRYPPEDYDTVQSGGGGLFSCLQGRKVWIAARL